MPAATITVQAKQSPAIGKKQGKVQDTNGSLWNVWGDKLQNYREGVTYDITYEESEFNGHRFNTIKTANPSNVGGQQYAPNPTARPEAAPRQAPQDGWPGPNPRPVIPPSPRYGATDEKTAERILVCGALNSVLENSNTVPSELSQAQVTAWINMFRNSWLDTFGRRSEADLDDRIPH